MNLKPLHDWAVIRPSGAHDVTAGGLYIPDTAKEKPREGVVEAIGPGAFEEEKSGKKKIEKKDRRFIPTTVKPGDVVVYAQYADRTYKVDGEERVLVRERDILGILPGGATAPNKPLQIPAVTTASSSTAVMKAAPAPSRQAPAGKKTAKAATKKAGGGKPSGSGPKKAAKKRPVAKKKAASPPKASGRAVKAKKKPAKKK